MLGIDTVVVSQYMPLPIEDCDSLNTLRLDVPDRDDVDVIPLWDAAVDFIEETRTRGGQVMVQIFGRSRSASLLMAWVRTRLYCS